MSNEQGNANQRRHEPTAGPDYAGENFVTKGARLMEELGMWLTVPAQALTRLGNPTVGHAPSAQPKRSVEPRQSLVLDPQLRKHSTAAAAAAAAAPGQHAEPALFAQSRLATVAGSGQQPISTSSQRQRPRPRRAATVVLDVIDDRTARVSDAGLPNEPPASAAVPIYERAAAALGGAAPAQPAAWECKAADLSQSIPHQLEGGAEVLQTQHSVLERSATAAEAPVPALTAPDHLAAASVAGRRIVLTKNSIAIASPEPDGERAVQQSAEDEKHIDVWAAAASPVDDGIDAAGGVSAPAACGALPLPEVAALSLEAGQAVPTAQHDAAGVRQGLQSPAAVPAETIESLPGHTSALWSPESGARRGADGPSAPASQQAGAGRSSAGVEIQPDGVVKAQQPEEAAANGATATHRRRKKRRRSDLALDPDDSSNGDHAAEGLSDSVGPLCTSYYCTCCCRSAC